MTRFVVVLVSLVLVSLNRHTGVGVVAADDSVTTDEGTALDRRLGMNGMHRGMMSRGMGKGKGKGGRPAAMKPPVIPKTAPPTNVQSLGPTTAPSASVHPTISTPPTTIPTISPTRLPSSSSKRGKGDSSKASSKASSNSKKTVRDASSLFKSKSSSSKNSKTSKSGKGKGSKQSSPTMSPNTFQPTMAPELIQCNQNRALSSGATILLNLTIAANEVTGVIGITAGVQQSFFHFTYVIDVSGSTSLACDGTGKTILDCEKEGLLLFNDRVIDANIAQSVSLVPFSSSASIAFTGDPDDPTLETIVNNAIAGGGTNFDDALDRSIQTIEIALMNPDVTNTTIIFLSDGDTNSFITNQVAMLASLGTEIQSFAVGTGTSCTNQLLQMAVGTGGNCTEVTDPAMLPDVLGEVVLPNRTIDTVTLTVDGAPVPFNIASPLPLGSEESPTDVTASLPPGTPGVTREVCFGAASEGDEALCCVDI